MRQTIPSEWKGLTAYERHVKYMNDYVFFYGRGKETHKPIEGKTDYDILRQEYRYSRVKLKKDLFALKKTMTIPLGKNV
jgi:hypothetical protein